MNKANKSQKTDNKTAKIAGILVLLAVVLLVILLLLRGCGRKGAELPAPPPGAVFPQPLRISAASRAASASGTAATPSSRTAM